MSTPDNRQFAPATQRNRQPILAILTQTLPPTGTVLEISSGTGEHAVYLAPALAPRSWLPSDPSPLARASIAAWQHDSPAPNLYPPLALDMCDPNWPTAAAQQARDLTGEPITAIVNINMIHIAPWSACLGLMAGARQLLPPSGILYLYGPYRQQGRHTAPSNAEFDQSLRAQNPDWGVRDLEAVTAAAQAQQLSLVNTYEMPANNLSVVFRRDEG